MDNTNERSRYNRLRRAALRQGWALHKSPRRDPLAYDYNGYTICERKTGTVVAGPRYGLTLDQAEDWLTEPPYRAPRMTPVVTAESDPRMTREARADADAIVARTLRSGALAVP